MKAIFKKKINDYLLASSVLRKMWFVHGHVLKYVCPCHTATDAKRLFNIFLYLFSVFSVYHPHLASLTLFPSLNKVIDNKQPREQSDGMLSALAMLGCLSSALAASEDLAQRSSDGWVWQGGTYNLISPCGGWILCDALCKYDDLLLLLLSLFQYSTVQKS